MTMMMTTKGCPGSASGCSHRDCGGQGARWARPVGGARAWTEPSRPPSWSKGHPLQWVPQNMRVVMELNMMALAPIVAGCADNSAVAAAAVAGCAALPLLASLSPVRSRRCRATERASD